MHAGRVLPILIALLCLTGLAGAADMELEDINFAFDSKSVIDDLKQIPHLVELLKNHPDTFLEISGHADYKGSTQYNQKLSLKRAEAVKTLLVDQGLEEGRITLMGFGEESPKAPLDKTRESRFINRRVVFSIYKLKDGQKDYYYKDNELIKPLAMAKATPAESDTSLDDLMKRIDDLEAKLLESQKETPREGCTQEDAFGLRRGAVSAGAGSYQDEIAGLMDGRLFFPFTCNFAVQANGVGLVGDDVKEFELSAGLVGKVAAIQIGGFGTFKNTRIGEYDDSASLSQFAVVAAYLFDRGSVGVYFSEAISEKEDLGVGTMTLLDQPPSIVTQPELDVANQFGVMFDYVFDNQVSIDAYAGSVHSDSSEFAGGLKVGYPLGMVSDHLRIFAQGNYNYGLVADEELALFIGFEISNWVTKKPVADDLRPMYVPSLSYGIDLKTTTNP